MENTLKAWLLSFLHLFFPRQCVVCGTPLQEGEEAICLRCNMDLPRTDYHLCADNPVERMFWGKIPLERATSYFFYHKGSDFRRILHQLKYGGRVPVPLHPRKQRMRGYNQSECVAKGVAAVTGIPLDAASVVRKKHTETQTSKSAYERWKNVNGIFHLRYPERFVGKHILLVDDVLTTGATITTCADVFRDVEGVRISVLTLAVANF